MTVLPVGVSLLQQLAKTSDLGFRLLSTGGSLLCKSSCLIRSGDLSGHDFAASRHALLSDRIPESQIPADTLQVEFQHLARVAAAHGLDRPELIPTRRYAWNDGFR